MGQLSSTGHYWLRKVCCQRSITAAHAPRTVIVAVAGNMSEVRKAATRGTAFAGSERSDIPSPLGSQAAGLFGWALVRPAATRAEWRALRAAAQALRKHQRAFTAEMTIFGASRRIRRVSWFEQSAIDRLVVAFDREFEASGCGRKGQPRDARPPVLNLRAQLQRHAAASLFWALRLDVER